MASTADRLIGEALKLAPEERAKIEVERVLPLIERAPASFPRLLDVPADLVIRRTLLPRFPYAVVFIDLGTELRVLAVAHAKRRPGYWLNRVAREERR